MKPTLTQSGALYSAHNRPLDRAERAELVRLRRDLSTLAQLAASDQRELRAARHEIGRLRLKLFSAKLLLAVLPRGARLRNRMRHTRRLTKRAHVAALSLACLLAAALPPLAHATRGTLSQPNGILPREKKTVLDLPLADTGEPLGSGARTRPSRLRLHFCSCCTSQPIVEINGAPGIQRHNAAR